MPADPSLVSPAPASRGMTSRNGIARRSIAVQFSARYRLDGAASPRRLARAGHARRTLSVEDSSLRCAHCDTEITDNALICYRCGKATAEPKVAPPRGHIRSRVVAIVALVLVIAASIGLRKTIADETTRVAVGVLEVVFIAILSFRIFRAR